MTGSVKSGLLFFGLACSTIPIGFFLRPDLFKNAYSNLFETKYLDFLVQKSNPIIVTTSGNATDSNEKRIPSGSTYLEFLRQENQKKRKSMDDLSQSKEELYENGVKNYKCAITLTNTRYSIFDNDCLIYKISPNVKKSSEILHAENLELANKKSDVEYDQLYVLKINQKSLKNNPFNENAHEFEHNKKMVIEVIEKTANFGNNNNRMFYLNLSYVWTSKEGWSGRTNFSLVSGKNKNINVKAEAIHEKSCKNDVSNPNDCVIFKINETTQKTDNPTDEQIFEFNLKLIVPTETSNDVEDNKYYVAYYPNDKFGVPKSVSIVKDYGYFKTDEIDVDDADGRIIELEYQKTLMGAINIQDVHKSQLFFIDQIKTKA